MDANTTRRKYPGYTLAQLEAAIAKAGSDANPVMVKEVADRKAGISVHFSTPQIEGGKPVPRVGRM